VGVASRWWWWWCGWGRRRRKAGGRRGLVGLASFPLGDEEVGGGRGVATGFSMGAAQAVVGLCRSSLFGRKVPPGRALG
jgi:hypothetical protein